jgi:molybdopterin biosynthesis enzyme
MSQRITRLTPVADLLARIDAQVAPVRPRSLLAEAGMTVAADLAAARMPVRALALRDGWAVAADAVGDAGPYAPAVLTPAPEWVDAGTPLPDHTDAVLPPDAVSESAGLFQAVAGVTPGEGVLPAGADAGPEMPLRKVGEALRAIDVAALRLAGHTMVEVRLPRVRLVATDPGFHHGREEIASLVARLIGGTAEVMRRDDLEAALQRPDADAIIAIGGTGEGRNDRSVQLLAARGAVEAHGVALSPGETAAYGGVGACPVLLLPGRFDAALAVLLVVGRPLLARLAGRQAATTGRQGATEASPVRLARKIASAIGLMELVPVQHGAEGAAPLASGLLPLWALTRADGYVLVPPEREGYAPGETVEMHPFP